MVDQPSRISVSLSLKSLQDIVEDIELDRERLSGHIADRDDFIRDAYNSGISYKKMIQITGLSRDRLYTIINNPSKGE